MNRYSVLVIAGIAMLWMVGCDDITVRPLRKGPIVRYLPLNDANPQVVERSDQRSNNTTYIHHHYPADSQSQKKSQDSAMGELHVTSSVVQKIPVSFDFTADYPSGNIVPDSVKFDGKNIVEHSLHLPGDYLLEIEKSGYHTITEKVSISEDIRQFILSRRLISKPREIAVEILDYETAERLMPESIVIDQQNFYPGNQFKPGQRTIHIEKQNYKTIDESFSVPVGEGKYTLTRKISRNIVPSSLLWQTETLFPPGEEIVVAEVRVDGHEMQSGQQIAPGKHSIQFSDPRFEVYSKQIAIASGEQHLVKAVLVPRPRAFNVSIQYDVEVPQGLSKANITLQNSAGKIIPYHAEMRIVPGKYKLSVEREAYTPFYKDFSIYPGTTPVTQIANMQAKPVQLKTIVHFDITPPQNLPNHVVTLIDQETQIRTSIAAGTIKPGKYYYTLEKPGYQMPNAPQPLVIEPTEQMVVIENNMTALPRQLSFDIRYGELLIKPDEVIVDGKEVEFSKLFTPGKVYEIVAKFRQYPTITQNVKIEPGSVPQIVQISLKK